MTRPSLPIRPRSPGPPGPPITGKRLRESPSPTAEVLASSQSAPNPKRARHQGVGNFSVLETLKRQRLKRPRSPSPPPSTPEHHLRSINPLPKRVRQDDKGTHAYSHPAHPTRNSNKLNTTSRPRVRIKSGVHRSFPVTTPQIADTSDIDCDSTLAQPQPSSQGSDAQPRPADSTSIVDGTGEGDFILEPSFQSALSQPSAQEYDGNIPHGSQTYAAPTPSVYETIGVDANLSLEPAFAEPFSQATANNTAAGKHLNTFPISTFLTSYIQ